MKKYIILGAVALLALSSCKTTEKNYRAAYETAIAKKAREAAADAEDVPADMISADAPRRRVIAGDTVSWKALRLIPDIRPQVEGPAGTDGQYFVAVGKYRMPTNARSGAARMRGGDYPGATAAQAADEEWYLITGRYLSLDAAAEAIKKFKADNPDYPYIGLDGAPLLIIGD